MKIHRKRTCAIVLALSVLFQAGPSVAGNTGAPPWWTERGVINSEHPPRDYSAINIGQAKNLAYSAYLELDEKLGSIGGAGPDIENLVFPWIQANPGRDDYAAMNVGMLKKISTPFYDRLRAVGYGGSPVDEATNTDGYPWTSNTTDDEDYSIVNAGMLKNVLSFDVAVLDDLSTVDADADGLLDVWEVVHNLDPFDATGINGASGDGDNDGFTNIEEQSNGTDPSSPEFDGYIWIASTGTFVDQEGTISYEAEGGDESVVDYYRYGGYNAYKTGLLLTDRFYHRGGSYLTASLPTGRMQVYLPKDQRNVLILNGMVVTDFDDFEIGETLMINASAVSVSGDISGEPYDVGINGYQYMDYTEDGQYLYRISGLQLGNPDNSSQIGTHPEYRSLIVLSDRHDPDRLSAHQATFEFEPGSD